tara:strand:+ start:1585 stop:2331 length:747 start_codon:yes stop_codon:yes gene_type:complete
MSDNTKNILELKDLKVSFKVGWDKYKEVLHGISFNVPKNKIFGFLGPNGSGKTTTIKTVLGLIPDYEGEIKIFGEFRSSECRKFIGFSPENAYFSPLLTPREVIRSMGNLSKLSKDIIHKTGTYWLERLKLGHVIDSPIKTFSKGMRQRLNIVQALLHDPMFLILDEPTTGLDPLGRQEIKQLIEEMRNKGKTILISTHNLLEAQQICDEICIIYDGQILTGGMVDNLLGEKQNLEEFFIEKVTTAKV